MGIVRKFSGGMRKFVRGFSRDLVIAPPIGGPVADTLSGGAAATDYAALDVLDGGAASTDYTALNTQDGGSASGY